VILNLQVRFSRTLYNDMEAPNIYDEIS